MYINCHVEGKQVSKLTYGGQNMSMNCGVGVKQFNKPSRRKQSRCVVAEYMGCWSGAHGNEVYAPEQDVLPYSPAWPDYSTGDAHPTPLLPPIFHPKMGNMDTKSGGKVVITAYALWQEAVKPPGAIVVTVRRETF